MQGASWFSKSTANLHCCADQEQCKTVICIFLRAKMRAMQHTSGCRMGTQPASFSYSSIASAILVVNVAEHCGNCSVERNKQEESTYVGTLLSKRCSERLGCVSLRYHCPIIDASSCLAEKVRSREAI